MHKEVPTKTEKRSTQYMKAGSELPVRAGWRDGGFRGFQDAVYCMDKVYNS